MNNLTTDRYGRVIYDRNDLYDMLLNGIDINRIKQVQWHNDFDKYNAAVELNHLDCDHLVPIPEYTVDIEEFDNIQQHMWFIPKEYMDMDVRSYIIKNTPENRLNRVQDELDLYDKYNLFDVLKSCVYLVDTMRKHDIVWGVGRGSSVASYVLYVIGIHKIDSVKYDLDINEFLK